MFKTWPLFVWAIFYSNFGWTLKYVKCPLKGNYKHYRIDIIGCLPKWFLLSVFRLPRKVGASSSLSLGDETQLFVIQFAFCFKFEVSRSFLAPLETLDVLSISPEDIFGTLRLEYPKPYCFSFHEPSLKYVSPLRLEINSYSPLIIKWYKMLWFRDFKEACLFENDNPEKFTRFTFLFSNYFQHNILILLHHKN